MINKDNNIINNIDLFKNQYNEKVLIDNIENFSLYDIVKTQKKLSKHFIHYYILNTKYNNEVTLETIQNYQPHYFTK
jgi:hypothetical protein